MQMAGISLFLVVDILIWPNTTADLITESVAKILAETLVSFRASIAAIRSLVEFFYRRNTIAFDPLSAKEESFSLSGASNEEDGVGATIISQKALSALSEMLAASSNTTGPESGSGNHIIDRISDDVGSNVRPDSKSEVLFDAELGLASEVLVSTDDIEQGLELTAVEPNMTMTGHREIALMLDLGECKECLKRAGEALQKAQGHTKAFKNLLLLVRSLFVHYY